MTDIDKTRQRTPNGITSTNVKKVRSGASVRVNISSPHKHPLKHQLWTSSPIGLTTTPKLFPTGGDCGHKAVADMM